MLQETAGERRTYSTTGYTHNHDFGQLILPLTGTLFIETQTYQFELDDASVFFLPPSCTHHFYACDTNEFLVLDIPSHLVDTTFECDRAHGIRAELEDRWYAIRTLLLAETSERKTGALLPLVQYINSLLTQSRRFRSLHYIHEHYHRSVQVSQLAQIEGYSPAYYSEWFKAKTGKTPQHFIQDLRVEQAKELLRHTDLPIHQIARQVGFEQASSLTRLFQKRVGATPSHYRGKTQNRANSFPEFS